MQTRNMEKSENNHQFKIIFNYNIFDKYFSKIFPWYKAVYGAIVFGVGILTVIFERYGQKGQAIFMLGGGVFLLIFWYAEKESLQNDDRTVSRSIWNQRNPWKLHLYEWIFVISKRFQAGKEDFIWVISKILWFERGLSFKDKTIYVHKQSAGTGGSFRFIFIDKEHMTHEEREIFLALIREKMPQIRNGNR